MRGLRPARRPGRCRRRRASARWRQERHRRPSTAGAGVEGGRLPRPSGLDRHRPAAPPAVVPRGDFAEVEDAREPAVPVEVQSAAGPPRLGGESHAESGAAVARARGRRSGSATRRPACSRRSRSRSPARAGELVIPGDERRRGEHAPGDISISPTSPGPYPRHLPGTVPMTLAACGLCSKRSPRSAAEAPPRHEPAPRVLEEVAARQDHRPRRPGGDHRPRAARLDPPFAELDADPHRRLPRRDPRRRRG